MALFGSKIFKKIILIVICVGIYVLLTSSIMQYTSERKVWNVITDSALEWSDREFGYYQTVIEREQRLSTTPDAELATKLKGKILLQVESRGEAWYLNPEDGKRYYLGKKSNAWRMIRIFAVKLPDKELFDYMHFEKLFPEALAGRFIVSEKNSTPAFYVDPVTRQGTEFATYEQAWQMINLNGIGVNNENMRKIPVGLLGK